MPSRAAKRGLSTVRVMMHKNVEGPALAAARRRIPHILMRVGGELPNPSNSPGLSDRAPRYVLLGCDCGSVDAIDFHGDGVDVFLPSAVVLAERTTLDDLLSDAARLNTFKSIATSLLSMNDPNANDQGRKGIHNTFWAV